MSAKENRKFRLLYRFLDENGLGWLKNEVGFFRIQSEVDVVTDKQFEFMRAWSDSRDDFSPLEVTDYLDWNSSNQDVKGFDECINYVVERIGDLVGYLEGSSDAMRELGILGLQFDEDDYVENVLLETSLQLKKMKKLILDVTIE